MDALKIAFLVTWFCFVDAGILKSRRRENEAMETLLAVGLLAKALSDADDKPSENHCPPMMTKYIHVPVYTERIIFLKENPHEELNYASSKEMWKRRDSEENMVSKEADTTVKITEEIKK
ncbi:uncharacterized protein [Parasteatoda tepidariorum]|uniref:uncharacterized protein n=1 Tax=Parasteatoda tepidariorum TaxID=114398 RepID=UPI001C722629|nr:uncharacterized protein LOC107436931 [Parasteatoda tepidariorum]